GKEVKWERIGEAMKIVPKSGSIITKRDFKDFKLHIEFKLPKLPPNVKGQGRGNSGVYIQRRYEIQILDSYGQPPRKNEGGSIYKFKAPDTNACKKPGEWQSYDIKFRAARFEGEGENAKKVKDARITLLHNGVLVHDDVDVPNKTGAGQKEGPEPGPILLQDHGNEVWFRNIRIVPL
ncbi:MAG: 3-keto-disaccharide hydrolase, partial [Planctomycetota bacterium]